MSEGLILLPEDARALKRLGRDGRAILRLAEKYNAYGVALSHIRNGRSLADFKQYLANDRLIRHATRQPKRWSDPY
jgi:hypothetical protein